MGLVTDIDTVIEDTLVDYVQTAFEAVAGPMEIVLQSAGILGLLFVALNSILQFKQINYSEYLQWGIRYVLVASFALIWDNFEAIYNVFIELPQDYSAIVSDDILNNIQSPDTDMLDPGEIETTANAIDEFSNALVFIAKELLDDLTIFDIGKSIRNVFMGAIVLVLAGVFTAGGAIVLIVGKVGFMMAVSLAPLAISMLVLSQTRAYFESWMKFTVGFALVPLLMSALTNIVLFVASEILFGNGNAAGDEFLKDIPFVMIMVAALVLLYQLPTMASTLASATVAGVGAGAAAVVGSKLKGGALGALGAAGKAQAGGQRLRDGASVGKEAKQAGSGARGAALAAVSGMRQSANMRQTRRNDRLARRMPTTEGGKNQGGKNKSAGSSGSGAAAAGRAAPGARTPHLAPSRTAPPPPRSSLARGPAARPPAAAAVSDKSQTTHSSKAVVVPPGAAVRGAPGQNATSTTAQTAAKAAGTSKGGAQAKGEGANKGAAKATDKGTVKPEAGKAAPARPETPPAGQRGSAPPKGGASPAPSASPARAGSSASGTPAKSAAARRESAALQKRTETAARTSADADKKTFKDDAASKGTPSKNASFKGAPSKGISSKGAPPKETSEPKR